MKKIFLLITILPLLFSCVSDRQSSDEVMISKEKQDSDEKVPTQIKDHEIIEKIEFIDSSGLKETLGFVDSELLDSSAVLPQFQIEKSMPSDPIEKLIVLKKLFYQYNILQSSPLLEDTVISIQIIDDLYFLGTLKGGLFQFDLSDHSNGKILIEPYESIKNRAVTDMIFRNNRLYIASFSGVFELNLQTIEQNTVSRGGDLNSALCLLDFSGRLYWGTSGGSLLSWDNHIVEKVFDFHSSIRSLAEYKGNLIIGTGNGDLYLWDGISENYQKLNSFNDHNTSRINDVLIIDDHLYIGTSSGVAIYNFLENTFVSLIDKVSVSSISDTEEYIYFGTNSRGVIIYDKIEQSFRFWNLETGLPSLEITTVKTFGHKVFLGLPDKGIVIINEEIHKKL